VSADVIRLHHPSKDAGKKSRKYHDVMTAATYAQENLSCRAVEQAAYALPRTFRQVVLVYPRRWNIPQAAAISLHQE
jgi:hypothetical protein